MLRWPMDPSDTPQLRPARPDDAGAIASVHVASWRHTYAGRMPPGFLERMTDAAARERREANWTRTLEEGRERVWVATQGGAVVGFASAGKPQDHPGRDAELFTLYTLPEVQGRGRGRALLGAVAGELRAAGARDLALWVLEDNPARAWYRRQGAREDGHKAVAVPGGELREVRMVWDDLGVLVPG